MKYFTTSKFALISLCFFVLLIMISPTLMGQCEVEGADDGSNLRIEVTSLGIDGLYQFNLCGKPILPEIDKFAGYRYFWDFGDGTYSLSSDPHHQYLTTGDFYPKAHLVKAYTSSKSVAKQLRTSAPSGGGVDERVVISPLSIPGGASYTEGDGYITPSLGANNISLATAFDLVPGYLQTFVLSFKNDCTTGGARSVTFSYPQGYFSVDSTTLFANPDDPTQTGKAYLPQNNPPDSADMIGPISGDLSLEEVPGAEFSSFTFSVDLPSNTTDVIHVFVNLFASPYLPIGSEMDFKLVMNACNNGRASAGSGNDIESSVPVRSSHDPNYKFVDDHSPATDKLTYISGSQPSKLTYRLAFQNEGNASVGNVSVFDTLAEELDFNTFKLLNITLADTNIPKSICDYPPIWRDYIWDNPSDASHYYEMSKDPGTRIVSWKFKTSIMGMQEVLPVDYGADLKAGDTIPEAWSWGYIDFEIYTKCGLPGQIEFANRAGIVFDDLAPVITDDVHVRRICYDNKTFVYLGRGFDLDVVSIAQRFYPNASLDPKTAVITHSNAGIPFPTRLTPLNSNGSEYRYRPDSTRYNRLDTLSIINPRSKDRVLVDNLRYTICDVKSGRCYPVSIYVLINPDGKLELPQYDCDGDCTPIPPVTDPYPKWWYWLAGIILFILLLMSSFRKRRSRRRRRK